MAACIANTSSIALAQDGAGTLTASSIVSAGGNQRLVSQGDGLSVRPGYVTYGWPFGGDDTYAVNVGVASVYGPVVYGPEVFAQTQTSTPGCVQAKVEWECQAGYTGSNTFSGVAFTLQYSYDHTNWGEFFKQSYYQPLSQTVLCHMTTTWPICWGDNGLHNFWVRLVMEAGAFGTGDVVTAQFSRRRSITMMY